MSHQLHYVDLTVYMLDVWRVNDASFFKNFYGNRETCSFVSSKLYPTESTFAESAAYVIS
jgi:hypothetical protein